MKNLMRMPANRSAPTIELSLGSTLHAATDIPPLAALQAASSCRPGCNGEIYIEEMGTQASRHALPMSDHVAFPGE